MDQIKQTGSIDVLYVVHMRPHVTRCNVSLADVGQVIENYEAIDSDERTRVPDKAPCGAKASIPIFAGPKSKRHQMRKMQD